MPLYSPRRLRTGQVVALLLRGLAALLKTWPLLLIAAMIISPVGPHLLWEYSYRQIGSHRHYISCVYLGSRGAVFYKRGSDCPVVAIIDRRASP